MRAHKIPAAGASSSHVVETGHQRGRPILFLHGVSQSSILEGVYLMLGYNFSVPRMFGRGCLASFNNDDLLPEDPQAGADYPRRM